MRKESALIYLVRYRDLFISTKVEMGKEQKENIGIVKTYKLVCQELINKVFTNWLDLILRQFLALLCDYNWLYLIWKF